MYMYISIYMAHTELWPVLPLRATHAPSDDIVYNSRYFFLFLWPTQNPLHLLLWYFNENREHAWELRFSVQTLVANMLTQLLQQFYGSIQLSGSFSRTTALDIWIVCCILYLHFVQHRNERVLQSIWETIIFKRIRWNVQIKQDILLALVLWK